VSLTVQAIGFEYSDMLAVFADEFEPDAAFADEFEVSRCCFL
jgi:hypothetical protein